MFNSLFFREIKMGLLATAVLGLAVSAEAQVRNTVVVRQATSAPISVMVVVDGKMVELPSAELVRSEQVMVWIRDLEKIGWGKVVSGTADQVIFEGNSVMLTFSKGQDLAQVNSLSVKLPINTFLRDGKFMVPLSFTAKALGYEYDCAYRPVAVVTTSPTKAEAAIGNTLRGRVVYNSRGVAGIKVRVADENLNSIKDVSAVTDENGEYSINGIPDGTCMAYVFIKDNPAYFNRASAKVILKDGKIAQLKPIVLGRLISSLGPKAGESVTPRSGKVGFAWTACEGAASYKLVVSRKGAKMPAVEAISEKPHVQISTKRFTPGTIYNVEITALDAEQKYLGGTAGAGGKQWTFNIASPTANAPKP